MLETMVNYVNERKTDKDFIATSNKFFYYNPTINLKISNSVRHVFVDYANRIKSQDPTLTNCDRSMLGKFPYLYKSISEEKSLRFPMIFDSNLNIINGCGRMIMCEKYFSDLNIPGIIISETELDNLQQIHSLDELINVITSLPYWQDKNLDNIRFGFSIGEEDEIWALEFQEDDPKEDPPFMFEFVENSGKENEVWGKVMSVVNSYDVINQSNIYDLIDELVHLDIS